MEGVRAQDPDAEAAFSDGESSDKKLNCTGLIDNTSSGSAFTTCPNGFAILSIFTYVKTRTRENRLTVNALEICFDILSMCNTMNVQGLSL
jgi:hypothetical protein